MPEIYHNIMSKDADAYIYIQYTHIAIVAASSNK